MMENTNYECEDISTLNEINLLRCKLETKSQVLKSISKELINCKKEKEEFKSMAEQLGEKCSMMKRRIERLSSLKGENEMNLGSLNDYNQLVLNQNYRKLQDSQKLLNFEMNDLRIKLNDAESDCRMLREKLAKQKRRTVHTDQTIDSTLADRKTNQHLVQQIEKIKMKNKELEKDLKLHLDEKEDLIKSRNNYIQKAERLNERLNALMKGVEQDSDSSVEETNRADTRKVDQFLDIDSILLENKFLKEKLACLEEDKKLGQELMAKYKHALSKTTPKKNFFEISNLTKPNKQNDKLNYLNQDNIVSTRELQSFIASNNLDHLELNESTLLKLRKLVLILFESISDKSAALSLAKTNNRLLGKRINDLENNLKAYESKEKNFRIEKMRSNERQSESSDLECEQTNSLNEEESHFECESKKSLENDLNEIEANRNVETEMKSNRSDNLIDLPNNLQILVERELEKLNYDE